MLSCYNYLLKERELQKEDEEKKKDPGVEQSQQGEGDSGEKSQMYKKEEDAEPKQADEVRENLTL